MGDGDALADARPGSAPRLVALRSSLVVAEGGRLLHWHGSDRDGTPRWALVPGSTGPAVVALAVCPDLDGERELVVAAGADGLVRSWTWQSDHSGGPRWVPWPPSSAGGPVSALTCWSARPGHQELVVAGPDGAVRRSRREDWREWGPWAATDVGGPVAALDVLPRAGAQELHAATTDGRLLRLPTDGAGPTQELPVPLALTALASWCGPDSDEQVVLAGTGDLLRRGRAPGGPWSDWSPLSRPPAIGTARISSVTGSTTDGQVLVAVAVADGSAWSCRGRRGEPPGPWRRILARPGDAPTEVWDGQGFSAPAEPTVAVAPATEPVPAPTEPVPAPTEPVPALAEPMPAPTEPVPAPTEPARVSQPAAEPVTRLASGRDLLPLLPDDPGQVGPFKLLSRIGGGQQATDKYLARDARGYCFLKVLRPEATAEETAAFTREIVIAQRVTNRHRLTTYVDSGTAGDRPFLALSYVAGRDLAEHLGFGTLEGRPLLDLAYQLLAAVSELAECGVVHGDVKPANVILRDEEVPVLVDFGSAVPADTTHVRQAAFLTQGYAPPELVRARETNPHTDVYGWAAVVVRAATGRPPDAEPAAMAAQLDRLPSGLREVVTSALADEPGQRPDASRALERLARTLPAPEQDLLRHRLPVETVGGLRARVARSRPRLVDAAAGLPPWRYRGIVGIMAVAGVVLGFVAGVLLRQLLEVLL